MSPSQLAAQWFAEFWERGRPKGVRAPCPRGLRQSLPTSDAVLPDLQTAAERPQQAGRAIRSPSIGGAGRQGGRGGAGGAGGKLFLAARPPQWRI